MRRYLVLVICLFILTALIPIQSNQAFAESGTQTKTSLVVFGQSYKLSSAMVIRNSKVLFPVNDLLLSQGVNKKDIKWDAKIKTLSISRNKSIYTLKLNSQRISKDSKKLLDMETNLQLVNGILYAPAKGIAEMLGNKAYWEPTLQVAIINKVNKVSKWELTQALLPAVQEANLPKVLSLLADGANPNGTRWKDNDSLLLGALFKDNIDDTHKYREISLALINFGADVNYKDPMFWRTPLRYAVENNEYQVANALLQKGANPNQITNPENAYADTAAHALGSIQFSGTDVERKNMLLLLNQYHADLNLFDQYYGTLLSDLIHSYTWDDRKYPITLDIAVKLGAKAGVVDVLDLYEAEITNELLSMMVKSGLDLNLSYYDIRLDDTMTLLEFAVNKEIDLSIIKELITLGADPSHDRSISLALTKLQEAQTWKTESEIDYRQVLKALDTAA